MNIQIVIIISIGIILAMYQLYVRNPLIGIYIRELINKHALTKYVLLYNVIQILLVVVYQNLSSADAFVFTVVFPIFWIICIIFLVMYVYSQIQKYKLHGISIIELIQLFLLTPIPFLWIVRSVAD